MTESVAPEELAWLRVLHIAHASVAHRESQSLQTPHPPEWPASDLRARKDLRHGEPRGPEFVFEWPHAYPRRCSNVPARDCSLPCDLDVNLKPRRRCLEHQRTAWEHNPDALRSRESNSHRHRPRPPAVLPPDGTGASARTASHSSRQPPGKWEGNQ